MKKKAIFFCFSVVSLFVSGALALEINSDLYEKSLAEIINSSEELDFDFYSWIDEKIKTANMATGDVVLENKEGIIDDRGEIEKILEEKERASVIIWLKDNEFTSPDYIKDLKKKQDEITKIQNQFISKFSEDDFTLRFLYRTLNGLSGEITKLGFEKIKSDELVRDVYFDGEVHATLDQSRPLINASYVQDGLGFTGQGAGVCVLDTGVNYNHPALGGCFGANCKIIGGYDFCNGPNCNGGVDPDPMDDNGHGTHVAGIVGAKPLSQDIRATTDSAGSIEPRIKIDSQDNLHVSWMDTRTYPSGLFYKKFNSNGANLTGDILVMNLEMGLNDDDRIPHSISVDNLNNVHFVGSGLFSPGNLELFYKKLNSSGANMTSQIRITFANSFSQLGTSSIVSDSQNNLHILWTDHRYGTDNLFYKKLNSNGSILINDTIISGPYSYEPSVDVDSQNNIHAAWNSNGNIKYKKLDSNGAVLTPEILITSPSPNTNMNPYLEVDTQNNVHIAWKNSVSQVYYKKLNSNGGALTSNIYAALSSQGGPSLSVDSQGNIHLSWTGWTGHDLHYKKLDSNGINITGDILLFDSSGQSSYPWIATDSKNNFHIVWNDDRDGNYEIYYKSSNGLANRGIAPDARIAALKVLNQSGSGQFSAVAAAIDWCILNSAAYNLRIITMSLGDGGHYTPATCPGWSNTAIQTAANSGIFIDAASGNEGYSNGISYPACSQNVFSVGAVYDANVGSVQWNSCADSTTFADKITCFTNRASNIDVLAPGSIITSTGIGGGFVSLSGTSMAAPHVAGAAAILNEAYPNLNRTQIENALKLNGKPIFDYATNLTFRRIDLLSAVNNPTTLQATSMFFGGSASLGNTIYFNINDPAAAGKIYILALSTATSPGIQLNGQTANISASPLFTYSLYSPQSIGLYNSQGNLDSNGMATAYFQIPNFQPLVGYTIYTAFLTYDLSTGQIISISPTQGFTIQN